MADVEDSPFDPTTSPVRRAPYPVEQFTQFLQNPQANAALLQAGLSLMGPRAWGQSGTGALAEAVGRGGEAAQRVGEEQRAEEEAQSRIAERGRRGDIAEQRADIAERTLGLKAKALDDLNEHRASQHDLNERKYAGQIKILEDRLKVEQDREKRKQISAELTDLYTKKRTEAIDIDRDYNQRRLKLSETQQSGIQGRSDRNFIQKTQENYQKYKSGMDKANAGRTRSQQQPVLPFDDWLDENGLRDMYEGAGGRRKPTTTAPAPVPTAPTTAPPKAGAKAGAQPTSTSPPPPTPALGTRRGDYVYQGGDPSVQSSWRYSPAGAPTMPGDAGDDTGM